MKKGTLKEIAQEHTFLEKAYARILLMRAGSNGRLPAAASPSDFPMSFIISASYMNLFRQQNKQS